MSDSEKYIETVEFATSLDEQDTFAKFRHEFQIPSRLNVSGPHPITEKGEDLNDSCVYLCGNSLGLMPKRSKDLIYEELDVWGEKGVEGHWDHPKGRPWVTIDELVKEPLGRLVGAKPSEVTAMNTLTSNIHSMLITFYRPTETRFKILIEKKAFPSDHYAVASHLESRGIDPKNGLLTIEARPGEHTIRTDDIVNLIKQDKEISVVMLSGIQYYTGQFFDIERITREGKEAGCIVGWDLAHAVGNVPLKLHDWKVDFACWCSYKYLNSGAGGIAGLFIHEDHHKGDRPRLAGWWGNEKSNRFEMVPEFRPSEGASGYQLSNPSIFSTISLYGSLQVFDAAGGIEKLRQKSLLLTGYLEKLLSTELEQEFEKDLVRILTPSDSAQRGCQLSLEFPQKMMQVFEGLHARGVIVDERKPTVIRVAPTPLYNSFKDVHDFVMYLKVVMKEVYV